MEVHAVEVEGVRFRYRKGGFSMGLPSFRVGQSETVAVLGRSGAGKTTLLNILSGCYLPERGAVLIQQTDITGMAETARRAFRIRNIGMVFQEFELLDHLNVLDNILLPYRITPGLRYERPVRVRAAALADEVGISDKLNRNVRLLSQGERQRVAVCRALLTGPSLLLCDEPTGNLDPENSRHVMDILFKYAADCGGTLIAVTHDHDSAARFDRTVDMAEILEEGQV